MKLAGYFNRTADLLFGIPLLLFGLYAVSTDITAAIYAAHGQRVFWVIGGGTIIGVVPLLIGCRLIFRSRRRRVNPPAPNPAAKSGPN